MSRLKNVLALLVIMAVVCQSLEWIPVAQSQLFHKINFRSSDFMENFKNYGNQVRVVKPPRNHFKLELHPNVDFNKPKSQSFYRTTLVQNQSPVYEFQYKIHDPKEENYQEKSEIRVGDSVRGYYSVREPNGYVRLVKYQSDENGFHSAVSHFHPEDNSMTRHF